MITHKEKQEMLQKIDKIKKKCPYKEKSLREAYNESIEEYEDWIDNIEVSHRGFISSSEMIYSICKAYANMYDYRCDEELRVKQSQRFDNLMEELLKELGVYERSC